MKGPSHSGAHIFFFDDCAVKYGVGSVASRLQEQYDLLLTWKSNIAGVRMPRASIRYFKREVHLETELIKGPGLIIACAEWHDHMEQLLEVIEDEFNEAEPADVSHLFREKLVLLRQKPGFQTKKGRQALDQASALAKDLIAPVGLCHGDLTLCNTLCDCQHGMIGDIALIDPIKPFCSSPLQDLAKVVQDTHRGWIALHVPEVNSLRLQECRRMVNRRFGEVLRSDAFKAFDALNLLRVFPYATSDVVRSWVKEEYAKCLTESLS